MRKIMFMSENFAPVSIDCNDNFSLISAAVFTIVSMLVIAIATVCLVQLHTRLFDKFLPDTSKIESWSDEDVDEHLALQTVRDFKFR